MIRLGKKALNNPPLIVGVDGRLAGLSFIFSAIIGANDGGSKIAAVVLFIAMCVVGRRLTGKDPNIFSRSQSGSEAESPVRSREAADQE